MSSALASQWKETAKRNAEKAARRKEEQANGIVSEPKKKKQGFGQKRVATQVAKTNLQSIPLENLRWTDIKMNVPSPCTIPPEKLEYDDEHKTKPEEPEVKFVNITSLSGEPVVVRLSGKGSIPMVTAKDNGDTSARIQLDDLKEDLYATQLCDSAMAALLTIGKAYYPKGCAFSHDDVVYRFYSKPTPTKRNPKELYPSSWNVTIKQKDVDSGEVVLAKKDGTPIKVVTHIGGMQWDEMRIAFTFALLGWVYREDRQKYFPRMQVFCKLIGKTTFTENPSNFHIVFPMQRTLHDAQNCERGHHEPIAITLQPTIDKFIFGETTATNGGGLSCNIHRLDNTNVILKFQKLCTLPDFAVGENQQKKMTLTVLLNDPEELAAGDFFTATILDHMLQSRTKFFPQHGDTEDVTLRSNFKPLIKKLKKDQQYDGRAMTIGIDILTNGTRCMIVDEFDQMVVDTAQLTNRRLQELWVSVYGVYVNALEAGFTKRVTYAKLAPANVTYAVD